MFFELMLEEPSEILKAGRFNIFLQLFPSGFILADNPNHHDCQNRTDNRIY